MNGEEYKYHKIKLTCGGATGLYYYEERTKANELIECLDTMEIGKEAVVVMNAVRMKDPKYAFSVSTGWSTVNRAKADDPWGCINFDVWYDGEKLGEYDGNSYNHLVKSRLTTKELRSTDWKRTKSMRTATKNILKYIKPIAMRERFDTLQRKVNLAAWQAVKNVSYMSQYHENKDLKSLYEIMFTKHRDVTLSLFQEVGKSEAEAKQMLDDYDSHQTLQAMREGLENGKGVLVIKYNNDIYMDTVFARHSKMITLQHKDLCDETKTHLAMLSLCNDAIALTDIGIKIDDTQFYLITTEEMTNA